MTRLTIEQAGRVAVDCRQGCPPITLRRVLQAVLDNRGRVTELTLNLTDVRLAVRAHYAGTHRGQETDS